MEFLTNDEILSLHTAAVSARLVESRVALLAGIDPYVVAGLRHAATPAEQLLMDLHALNAIRVLANGSMPIAVWLANAVTLVAVKPEAAFFDSILARCRGGFATGSVVADCPFPGLEFFDEDRTDVFFGRDAEIEDTLQRLDRTQQGYRKWLQIEGPTGAGKSSLVRAGIVPRVRKGGGGLSGHKVSVFRPGPDPLINLAEAVRAVLGLDSLGALDEIRRCLESSDTALASLLREQALERTGSLLIVDQLEEVFTLAPKGATSTRHFGALLAHALRDAEGSLRLITTIRSDFLGRFAELPELERLLNTEASRYHLKAMIPSGVLDAIRRPALQRAATWDDGLPERIVGDAASHSSGLPLVAHVLRALWVKRKGDRITRAAYDSLGGVGGALTQSADEIISRLGDVGLSRARKLLLRLIKIGRAAEDVRQAVTRRDALEAAGGDNEAEFVLVRLSGGRDPYSYELAGAPVRLVMVSGEGDSARVDLVHEALIKQWPTLRSWIDEGRKELERRDDVEGAALVWLRAGKPLDGLPKGKLLAWYGGAGLDAHEHERFRQCLSELGKVFVEQAELAASDAEEEAQKRAAENLKEARALAEVRRVAARRLKQALVAAAMLLAVLCVAALLTYDRQREAQNQTKIALSRQLAAQAISVKTDSLELAALLAVNSGLASPTFENRSALLDVLGHSPRLIKLLHTGNNFGGGNIGLDGEVMMVGGPGTSITMLNMDTGEVLRTLTGYQEEPFDVVFAEGAVAASAVRDGLLLWDLTKSEAPMRLNVGRISSRLAIDSNGRWLASVVDGARIAVWDLLDRHQPNPVPLPSELATGSIQEVVISPSGELFAVLMDKAVGVWRLPEVTHVRTFAPTGLPDRPTAMALSVDGERLAVGYSDGTVRLWNLLSGSADGSAITAVAREVRTLRFDTNGRWLVSGSSTVVGADNTANLVAAIDLHDKDRRVIPLRGLKRNVFSVAVSRDRVLAADYSGTIGSWDLRVPHPLASVVHESNGDRVGVTSVRYVAGEERIVARLIDGRIGFWDRTSGARLGELLDAKGADVIVAAPDGSRMATAGDQAVTIWDAKKMTTFNSWSADGHVSLAYDSGSTLLAIGSEAGWVELRDRDGHQIGNRLNVDKPCAVAFKGDGTLIVIGDRITFWDPKGLVEVQPSFDYGGGARRAVVDPTGRIAAILRGTSGVLIWDLQKGKEMPMSDLNAYGLPLGLSISGDGRTLAIGDLDAIILIDLTTGRRLGRLVGHTHMIVDLSFSSDGTRLLSGSFDGRLLQWDLRPLSWATCACRLAGGDLKDSVWSRFMGDMPYVPICSALLNNRAP